MIYVGIAIVEYEGSNILYVGHSKTKALRVVEAAVADRKLYYDAYAIETWDNEEPVRRVETWGTKVSTYEPSASGRAGEWDPAVGG